MGARPLLLVEGLFGMKKLAAPLGAVAVLTSLAAPAPAVAQAQAPATTGQRMAEIVVFGTDPCPRSTEDEVVVCTRVPESYRYRMPEAYRQGGTFQQRQAWTNKAKSLERVGRSGIQSCSPVGPAGYTGCLEQMINGAKQEANEAAQQQTAPRK
jgi:hypothetical protein